ncbi:brachyurin-like isoform X11 [Schistocerca nitens]|uniref:brachyurin-like isoform X11 n=1 Tax=Schistocerca nitens TaxID=7011 RepID=UPI002119285E|nr:brachyurin-like isoform X11 [Schistocerca nitens]
MTTLSLHLLVLAATVIAAQAAVNWSDVKPMRQHVSVPVKVLKGAGRITNGEVATLGQFPYQAGLIITVSEGQVFCGGSIISDTWILTAAHCADPGTLFEIHLGALYVRQEEAQQVVLSSTTKIVHNRYVASPPSNDIALVQLPSAVSFNEYIQPVNLPSSSELNNKFVGAETTVSGWGLESDSSEQISEVLRYAVAPVISHLTCNLRYLLQINDDMHICTSGDNGVSTCNGDSGGPLVIYEDDGSATQIGIVSFGIILGCEVGWPPVFTRVTNYMDWISENSGIAIRS